MRWALLLACTLTLSNAEDLHRGWWHGREITYRVSHGRAIYQRDIVIGRAGEIPTDSPEGKSGGAERGAAFLTGNNNVDLWPNAAVPYAVDPSVKGAMLTTLNQAIQLYQTNTPIRWVQRTNQPDYVNFTTEPADSDSCGFSDGIGVYGGVQNISINPANGCASLGTFVHEMGHAIGFEHEQTRWDRDYYVRVRYENIDKNSAIEYDRDAGQIDVLPYDQGSIMHYSPFDFQRNTLNTIDTIPLGIPIAHRNNLSAGDIEAIRTMYGSPSTTTTIYTNPGGLNLIIDGQTVKTPVTMNWAQGSKHTLDVPAAPQGNNTTTRYMFGRWSNDGPKSQTITTTPQNRVIAANFITQYFVTAVVSKAGGGTVSVTPSSPDGFYTFGTLITVTAMPATGNAFLQWDNPDGLSIFHGLSSNSAAFTVNYPGYEYTADFTKSPVTAITTNIPGTEIVVDGTSVLLPANFAWVAGSAHTVAVAKPTQDNGAVGSPYRWVFQNWSDGKAQSHSVTASASGATLGTSWQKQWLVSTYTADPANPYGSNNGSVAVSPASASCGNPTATDCYYNDGAKITFTPSAVAPFVFNGWSDDLNDAGTAGSLTVSDQVYVTANFAQPGRLVRAAVVDAANYQGQGVAPGELITIFGLQFGPPAQLTTFQLNGNTFATTLAQTQVLFDGNPAPLVYVSANQIAAIVPYTVAGKATTRMTISYQGKQGNGINVNVLPSHPGLFTGAANLVAALNQDGSIHGVNNPAARGSVLQLFGTGEGVTKPAGVDGRIIAPPLAGPVLPLHVYIAGREAQVLYFGGAPGLVTGVFQANVVIPADSPTGVVPISVTVGTTQSPAFTRIAVQ